MNWNVPLKVPISLTNDGNKTNDAQIKIKCWGYVVANGRNFGCITQKGPRRDVVERTLSLPNVSRNFSNERKSAYFQVDFSYILFSM
jgi:hypothetical protein